LRSGLRFSLQAVAQARGPNDHGSGAGGWTAVDARDNLDLPLPRSAARLLERVALEQRLRQGQCPSRSGGEPVTRRRSAKRVHQQGAMMRLPPRRRRVNHLLCPPGLLVPGA
jgi:hypothetical protein